MTLKEAIDILEKHQSWRQGFNDEMVSASVLTAAIHIIIQTLRELKYANV